MTPADHLEACYTANYGRFVRLATKYLRNQEDAEECVQDAFLRAWERFGQWDQQGPIDHWIAKIVVNACLMRLRHLPDLPLDPLCVPRVEPDAFRQVFAGECHALLVRALPTLSRGRSGSGMRGTLAAALAGEDIDLGGCSTARVTRHRTIARLHKLLRHAL